jgi:tetratricopeptide (TPR) repeat protein
MKTTAKYIFGVSMLLASLSGCASFQAASDVQLGRRAFLVGDDDSAVGYFGRAAKLDPDYVYDGTAFRENIWSFLGRSEYAAGQFAEARQSLAMAITPDRDETNGLLSEDQDMARLYLGLTLARTGDNQGGIKQIVLGMRGIYDDIDYETQAARFSSGEYWDPTRAIRASIEGDLAMLSGKQVNMPRLIADGEWLGKKVEEEIDSARRDENHQRGRDS